MFKNINLKIYTIGAYGFNESSFLKALKSKHIDTFCDIRQRRGMRGSEYSWANSNRLQENLKEIGINYVYLKSLAPTNEIREKQKNEDMKLGVNKRDRIKLGLVFTALYKENCLVEKNLAELLDKMPSSATNIVFFCVEKSSLACHRSLLADHLVSQFNIQNGGDIGHGNANSF